MNLSDVYQSSLRKAGIFILFAGIIFAAYSPTLKSPFIFDDDSRITDKEVYYKEGLIPLIQHFWHIHGELADRPATTLSLWLNYKLSGLSVPSFKAVNILLHLFASFVFFAILSFLWRIHAPERSWIWPLSAASLFLIHPVHTMVVNMVTQRSVLQMALFGGIGFYMFLRWIHVKKTSINYLFPYMFFLLSILSKPNGIVFIPLLFLYITTFESPEKKLSSLKSWLPAILFVALPIYVFLAKLQPQMTVLHPLQYLSIEVKAIWIYLKIFLIPSNLSFWREISGDYAWVRIDTWIALFAHLGFIMLGLKFLQSPAKKIAGFGILTAYISLAPESSILPMSYFYQEYRTYVSFCFLGLSLFWIISSQRFKNILLFSYWLILFPVLGTLTYERNLGISTYEDWHYDMVWNYQLDRKMNFAAVELLNTAGKPEKAKKLLDRVITRIPESPFYAYLRELMNGPNRSLEVNIQFIKNHKAALQPLKTLDAQLFLSAAYWIIERNYPQNQKDRLIHEIFFVKSLMLRMHKDKFPDLFFRYQDVLRHLSLYYQQLPNRTADEELEREKVTAAQAILTAPGGITLHDFFARLIEEHPNWRIFFE